MTSEIYQKIDVPISDLGAADNDLSRSLKVLYVTHDSNLTGASRSLLDLLSGLDRDQIEPTVLLRRHGPLEEKLKEIDVPYKIFTYTQATKSPHITRPVVLKSIINYFAVRKISNYIIQNNFDLVHQNSLLVDMGMRAALQARVPYICHLRELVKEGHGLEFLNENRQANLVKNSDAAVAISSFLAMNYSNWAPVNGFSIIYDGLNIDDYLLPHSIILNKETISLLLPGRIAPNKGQLEAIKAMELLIQTNNKVHLTIIGSIGNESYMHDIKCFISEHKLESYIDIKEFTDDIKYLYSQADISLMCSQNEAMGRVTIEGMLAGCLVIGADAGATSEIISDGENGLLYVSGDPQDLADRINYAIRYPHEMQTISKYAQKWAKENFNNLIYANRINSIYHNIAIAIRLDMK